ncbi:MAG: Gfo/Idh/MocA family oxidoreductase, partial [Verrucomicrobia bacterium]|nr:Gfo/Idh/MocA family oxidoreductase [Verrucomicrobiota bacterium]
MNNKVHWALVGCGDISKKRVAPAIRDDVNSVFEAVVSRSAEKGRQFAREFGARKAYPTLAEALKDGAITAVYLATPVFLHCPETIAAAQAGRHVLCEKPMAMNAAECERMVAAAKANGVKLGVAYYRRFYPKLNRAKELLAEGRIGAVTLVRIAHGGWYAPTEDDPKSWRVHKERSGGGPMLDVGSHRLDILVYLFDQPVSVMGRAETLTQGYDVEDSASLLMKLKCGAHASAHFNWNWQVGFDEFEIVGTRGRIDMKPFDGPSLTLAAKGEKPVLETLPPHANVHLPLVADFTAAVLSKGHPRCPGEEGAKTTRIIDAVFESGRTGCEVRL